MQLLSQFFTYLGIISRMCFHSFFSSESYALHNYSGNGLILKHALRSPVTAILLNLESSLILPNGAKTYTERALQATKHLIKILNSEPPQRFLVLPKLKQITTLLSQPFANRYVYLISKLTKPIYLQGEALSFQEALSCVITNSFEAYPTGQPQIAIVSVWNQASALYLVITDYGSGMTWLTKKLSTAKGFTIKTNNTGYGLWYAEKVIEKKYQGKIVVASQSKVGTMIKIELPIATPDDSHTPERFEVDRSQSPEVSGAL